MGLGRVLFQSKYIGDSFNLIRTRSFVRRVLFLPHIYDPIFVIAWPYPLNILSDCQCSFSLRSRRFRSSYCMVRKLEWGRNNGGRETGRGEGETFFLVYPSPLCSFSLLSFQLSSCSCWNVTRIMFAFVGGSSCKNRHVMCATWAGRGECRKNPGYMTVYCKKSCRVCWGKSRRNIRPT